MSKGGRPRDPVWFQFEVSQVVGKMNCKTCHEPVSSKADRLRSHLKKCSPTPVAVVSNGGQFDCPHVPVQPDPPAAMSAPSVPHKRMQSTLFGHVVTTSHADKDKLDKIVAEFVFACNLPFSVVEQPHFMAMLDAFRPGYKPLTRKAIGGHLLDKSHARLQSTLKAKIENKTVTMQQDGWSTPSNEPVISTSVTCDGVGYCIDAQLTGSKSKTAEACQEMLTQSKAFAEDNFDCRVRSVVTDNAPAMAKMREGLDRDDQDLITYGCLAHWLNLVGKDTTDNKLLERVEKINRHFRNKHIPGALLRDYPASIRPQLSVETRWNSQLSCFDSYITNREFMLNIIHHHPGAIDKNIETAVMDNALYQKVVKMAGVLRPISIALLRAQGDSTSLADGYDIMHTLMANPLLAPYLGQIKKRRDQAILPCHMFAYMLHPKYNGQGMDLADAETARAWLADINPEFVAPAISFQAQAHPYPKSFFGPTVLDMKPSTWWQSVGRNSLFPEGFVELIVNLHMTSASSSCIERVFSTFGLVMTKLRNRLDMDKAQKLVFCYRMLRGPTELEY